MRYEKGHKEATRQHIVEVASRQFRENGVAAAGLAGIMSAAGLTNGAFYAHFESKEDLVRAVLTDALDRRERGLAANLKANAGLEKSIRDYLGTRHRDNAGAGCPTAALAAEIARHPQETREVFTGKAAQIISLIAAQLRGRLGCRAAAQGDGDLRNDGRRATIGARGQRQEVFRRDAGERHRRRAGTG